ncbi:rRNA-binding ribosome biosynthesis protein utp25 [Myotisia sp. PD_48]|nr:rRNA-binding ribosome biosynthesis protein utp25 [Myotisia sp. PD_48]
MAFSRKRAGFSRPNGSAIPRHKKTKFETSRQIIPVQSGSNDENKLEREIQEEDNEDGDDAVESVISTESEDEQETTEQPYNILLKVLNAVDRPSKPSKKRKKSHSQQFEAADSFSETARPENDDPELLDDPVIDDSSGEEDTDAPSDTEGHDGDHELNGTEPFNRHFADPDESELTRRLEASSQKWNRIKSPLIDKLNAIISVPATSAPSDMILRPVAAPQELMLKKSLLRHVTERFPRFGSLGSCLAPYIFEYLDMLFCARSPQNSVQLRELYCLHALNHLLKTRDSVIRNSSRLLKASEGDDIELRDQGFTRPKVLMILPTRQACVRVVETLSKLYHMEQQENRKRFFDNFSSPTDKDWADKPEDFKELFGGNDDDMFRIGLKFTRKTLKYFSQFYTSDIILASPLGLRTAMEKESGKGKPHDHDFLSSIELVIVDNADALLMQNWDHVGYIFSNLNLQPKEAHGCDFSRVRKWYLDGQAKHLRQTLVFSSFITPELNSLFASHMHNVFGKMKITPTYEGAMFNISSQGLVRQTFSRFNSLAPAKDPEARFKYFTNAVLANLVRNWSGKGSGEFKTPGTLIFVPSYLDFIQLRNYFATSSQTTNFSFGLISEYTSVRESSVARSHFMTGSHSFLLYTERAHHFRRYKIRGVKRVIMYGLPENPLFWQEIVGFLHQGAAVGAAEPSIRALFSKWDALKLERIVGIERAADMLTEKGDTFTFV